MRPVMTATWNSRIATYRARVNKQTGDEVSTRLIRIRDRWAADLRVASGHYRDTVRDTEPEMTSPTSGRIQPPFEVYFAANEYGGPTISSRPSMRQAMQAEQGDFFNTIDSILKDIGL